MKKIIISLLLLVCAFQLFAQTDITQQIVKGRYNSPIQQHKPYVILISADGFRYDYAQKYHANHLLALSNGGVSAASLVPSFPSITFPNHYTLVTGLYPAHHGLVGNTFFDPKLNRKYNYKGKEAREGIWYGGIPLWVLAEQQHMLSASFYWVGSEAPIKGILPSYYYHYNEKINIHNRIEAVKNWLKLPVQKRPHLITFYFPEVDHAGHKYGPEAPETAKQVRFVDSAVNELVKTVNSTGLKVNYILVSDHGMAATPDKYALNIPPTIDTTKFIVSGDATMVQLYARKGHRSDVGKTYRRLRNSNAAYSVYLKKDIPAYLHYGAKDDKYNRIGDILLIPHYPHVFRFGNKKVSAGNHGFDPYQMKNMHAVFYAWGPAFNPHLKIPSFKNVEVYPIVTQILGLNITGKIDGTAKIANEILR